MCLDPDTELGPFLIRRLLGKGGMGEVYLAHDRHLDRSVAVKVVPPTAVDAQRLARFEQEARAASTLSHPNVAHVYQLGQTSDGRRYLAMEYVEGDSLEQRLVEPLPLAAALDVGVQIAAALAAAHAAGVVHRDIKPANVIVRGDGLVKVLDFGLAKLSVAPAAPARGGPTQPMPVTEPGAVVGTADYMSPEQARGREVDARTDLWALGVVIYEMVARCRPFEGATRVDVLAAVLEREPVPLTQIDPRVPPELERIVGKALRKEPVRRYQTADDLLLDLQALAEGMPMVDPAAGALLSPRWGLFRSRTWPVGGRAPRRGHVAAWLGAIGLGLGAWQAVSRWPPAMGRAAPLQQLSAELGADATLATTDAPFALSRDGALVAFVARPRGRTTSQLYVRRLDQLAAMPVAGTDGAAAPCFSPDARWLAFFADAELKKVPVTGGAVVTVADAPEPRGAWWAEDDTIVFAPHFRRALSRVSASGGPVTPLTHLLDGEISHRFPQVLPGGRAVLYTASTEVNIGTGAALVVQALPSGARTVLQRGGYFGRYLSSGHVVYAQDDSLFAMPFAPGDPTVTGAARRIVEGIAGDAARGSAHVALSALGTLAYSRGRNLFDPRPMAWLSRAGALTTLRADEAAWQNPEFSPDGRRIAMDIDTGGQRDVYVYDWARGAMTRVTTESTHDEFPVWTPDGVGLVYRSVRSSTDPSGFTLAWKRADGTGAPQVLLQARTALKPGSWHPTRNVLAYTAMTPDRDEDVLLLPIDGDPAGGWRPGPPAAFAATAARERLPRFSPDGAWLAYSSNDAIGEQVYVQPFPGPGGRVVVSGPDGVGPSWSRARSEIVFSRRVFDYRHALMVASYRVTAGTFAVGRPRPWADGAATLRELSGYRLYALHPDGVRVALAPPAADDMAAGHLVIVSNLSDELRRIVPPRP